MGFQTLYSTKKTFYYNFVPTKAEEEALKARKASGGLVDGRVLTEIRDLYPQPTIDPSNPWIIKKTLNQYEVVQGKLALSCNDAFEHVIRYWTFGMSNYVTMGYRIGVYLWDATDEENPRKYHGKDVYLQMMPNDDFVLSCLDLFKKLKVDDQVLVYWDCKNSCFKFKALLE